MQRKHDLHEATRGFFATQRAFNLTGGNCEAPAGSLAEGGSSGASHTEGSFQLRHELRPGDTKRASCRQAGRGAISTLVALCLERPRTFWFQQAYGDLAGRTREIDGSIEGHLADTASEQSLVADGMGAHGLNAQYEAAYGLFGAERPGLPPIGVGSSVCRTRALNH
ncbi:hypothetical protein NOVOSPHI9U_310055 [Novosphingobium sp. 9U]|nr:hypothetical protein NOVOSPHI9U_310055 [Novosphingobium sp. 9U]